MGAGMSFFGGFLEQYNTVKDEERAALAKEAEANKKRTADLEDWYTKQQYQEKETIRAEDRALTTQIAEEERAETRTIAGEERKRIAAEKKAQEKRSRVSKAVLDEYDIATSRFKEGITSDYPLFSYDPAQDVPKVTYLDVKGSGLSLEQSQLETDRMNKQLENSGIRNVQFINAPQQDGGYLPTKVDIKKEDVGPPMDKLGYVQDNKYLIQRHIGNKDLIKADVGKYDVLPLDANPLGSGTEQADRFANRPDSYFVFRTQSNQSDGKARARELLGYAVTDFTPDRVRQLYANKDKTEAGAAANQRFVSHMRNLIGTFKGATVVATDNEIKWSNPLEEQPELARLADAHPELKQLMLKNAPPDMSTLDPVLRDTVFADLDTFKQFENSGTFPTLANLTSDASPFAIDGENGTKLMEPQFKEQVKTIVGTSGVSPSAYLSAVNYGVNPATRTASTDNAKAIHSGVMKNRTILAGAGGFMGPDGIFRMPVLDDQQRLDLSNNLNNASSHNRRLLLLQASLTDSSLRNANSLLKDESAAGMYEAVGKGGVTNFNRMVSRGNAATDLYKDIDVLDEVLKRGGEQSVVAKLRKAEAVITFNAQELMTYFDTDVGNGTGTRVKNFFDTELRKVQAIEDQQLRLNATVALLSQSINYKQARMLDEDGRLSVDDIQRVEASTGLGSVFAEPITSRAVLDNLRRSAEYHMSVSRAYQSMDPKQVIAARAYEDLVQFKGSDFLSVLGYGSETQQGTTGGTSGGTSSAVADRLRQVQQMTKQQQQATDNAPVSALEQQTREQSEASVFKMD